MNPQGQKSAQRLPGLGGRPGGTSGLMKTLWTSPGWCVHSTVNMLNARKLLLRWSWYYVSFTSINYYFLSPTIAGEAGGRGREWKERWVLSSEVAFGPHAPWLAGVFSGVLHHGLCTAAPAGLRSIHPRSHKAAIDPHFCGFSVVIHRRQALGWQAVPRGRGLDQSSWAEKENPRPCWVQGQRVDDLPCPAQAGACKKESEVTQSHPNLCNPMDCSLPDSSVHGILQARILEWVAISFSRGSSQPRDGNWVSCTAGGFFTVWAPRGLQTPCQGAVHAVQKSSLILVMQELV